MSSNPNPNTNGNGQPTNANAIGANTTGANNSTNANPTTAGNVTSTVIDNDETILDRLTAKKIADIQGLIFEIAYYNGGDKDVEAEQDGDVKAALDMLDVIDWAKAADVAETDDLSTMETDVDILDIHDTVDEAMNNECEDNAA